MTENKRFTLTYIKIGEYFDIGIVDHETKEPFDDAIYEFHQCSFKDSKDEMEDLCLLLNELNDENEQLKKEKRLLANDNSNNLPEKFLCSLNRVTNEVIIFEKGSDIDLVKFISPNLEDATLIFNGMNPICDKLNELSDETEQLKSVNMEYEDALGRLEKENEQLKKDRFICLDCEHSGYTEIGCLCEYTDNWQEHITECEDFKELEE